MRFQERQETKNHSDQQGSYQKVSVRYLGYSRLSGVQPDGFQIASSSPSTLGKQRFQTVPFSNRSTLGERFRIDPFSLIIFSVVWTIALSGTKQHRFRLKTD